MRILKLLKTVPGFLAGIILGMGLVTTAAVYAVDRDPPGFFELEGNVVNDAGAVPGDDDWEDLAAGGGSPIAFTTIIPDPAPTSIYWKGGSKDINDVTEWWWKDGSVPDKDDITNAYAAAYVVDDTNDVPGTHDVGDLIIYFGLDRYANDGDAFAGFWFFQDDVGLSETNSNRFDGAHVGRSAEGPGDVLVLVEYPQGSNAMPEIKIYEWDPLDLDNDNIATNLDEIASFTNAVCDASAPTYACATTNHDLLPFPSWDYEAKDGSLGIPFESFFEGGINLTKLLGSTPCISAFLAETRSSRSETAQLKDFVVGSFDVCGIQVTKSCINADLNASGDELVANFSGTVKNNGGIGYIANLLDTFSGAVITEVCFDAGSDGSCSGDATPTGLSGLGTDDVEFDLGPGEEVLYLAGYTTTTIPGDLLADNDVAVYAYTDAADVGDTSLSVADGTASATCAFDVTPGLTVDKNCIAELNPDGASVDIYISGTVSNTGNVALNVDSIVDSNGDFDSGDFPAILAPQTDYPFSKEFNQLLYAHSDTLTVNATAALGSPPVVFAESDTANCSYIPVPDLDVTKDCDATFVDGDSVYVEISGTVSNTSEVAMTNVYVTDTVLGVLAGPLDLGPAGSGTDTYDYTHNYYPELADLSPVTDELGVTTFTHTDSVEATGDTVIQASEGVAYASDETGLVDAECDTQATTTVDIDKLCSTRLAVVDGKVVVVVDVETTITNTGTENLTNLSVIDDPLVAFVGDVPEVLLPGESFGLTGSYYPDSVNSENPQDAEFGDTVTVTADGAFSEVDAEASEDAICSVCI